MHLPEATVQAVSVAFFDESLTAPLLHGGLGDAKPRCDLPRCEHAATAQPVVSARLPRGTQDDSFPRRLSRYNYSATIWVGSRIASWRNAPEDTIVASLILLPRRRTVGTGKAGRGAGRGCATTGLPRTGGGRCHGAIGVSIRVAWAANPNSSAFACSLRQDFRRR